MRSCCMGPIRKYDTDAVFSDDFLCVLCVISTQAKMREAACAAAEETERVTQEPVRDQLAKAAARAKDVMETESQDEKRNTSLRSR